MMGRLGGRNKKSPERGLFIGDLAERVGFEPTVPCGTPDFESGTFGHSATSPSLKLYQDAAILSRPAM